MEATAVPEIDREICDLCGDCVAACPTGALSIVDEGLQVDLAVCAYCGKCEEICPKEAIRLPYQVIWPDD